MIVDPMAGATTPATDEQESHRNGNMTVVQRLGGSTTMQAKALLTGMISLEQIVAETSKYTPVKVRQVKAVKTTEYDYLARPLNRS